MIHISNCSTDIPSVCQNIICRKKKVCTFQNEPRSDFYVSQGRSYKNCLHLKLSQCYIDQSVSVIEGQQAHRLGWGVSIVYGSVQPSSVTGEGDPWAHVLGKEKREG